MGYPQNLFEIWSLYQLHVETKNPPTQAKRILNEAQSAILRILLRGLGYNQSPAGRKMTQPEINDAQEFMKTLSTERLFEGRTAVKTGLNLLKLSQTSRNTYGGRLDNFLTWCEEQPWWGRLPSIALLKETSVQNSYCPSLRRGYGTAVNHRLTSRRGVYITYQLQPKDVTPQLEAELQDFYHFLTDPDRDDRRVEAVSHSTAQTYVKHIRLMLGWFRLQGTPRKHLSLELLIPKLTENELEELTFEQREVCWKARKLYIETWICQYFQFLREDVGSQSPKTNRFKTHALTALGKFQYRTEVGSNREYGNIPVLKTINKYANIVRQQVATWENRKDRVVSIDKKWPEVMAGQTALTTVRKQVVEVLRSFCRPKYSSNGHFRSGSAITSSLRDYLAWSTMTDMPARRQEEVRSWRISLSCPIQRPEEVPCDGLYHPLPPDQVRERDEDNQIADNYLYKTYVRKGKFYPDGIWVLDIHSYKTQKRYGPQSIMIKNRRFADGSYFYDYIEHYLYGWWNPDEDEIFPAPNSWDFLLTGNQGQWVSLGRSEFQPRDVRSINTITQDKLNFWSWGYFFVAPRTGNHYDDSAFKDFFSKAAHHVIGKRITPHIIRDMWATWAYQMGLTDAQRESLAYAMGMDLKTLEEHYEKCSPDEKRRPIEEVIDRILFGELETEYHESTFYVEKLAKELLELAEIDRLNYLKNLI